jgi:murein DD-endopeptidase MepM/ murein hydrolase activator NlpD
MRTWGVLAALVALLILATGSGARAFVEPEPARWPACPCGPQSIPAGEPVTGPRPAGYTGLPNPAPGQYLVGTPDDPLAAFSRRPLDRFIVPAGGTFLDPLHLDPHYGVDYTYPDDYLAGKTLWVHPIGPGYVTARSACLLCFVDGDAQGRTTYKLPRYNFGFGAFVLVETPVTSDVSIYTMYAHLARDFAGLGDYVHPDQIIGVAGNTGYSENVHVHLEVRYGKPGRFWNADFSQWATLDRWMAMMFVNPAWLVFPENHGLMILALEKYIAEQPRPADIP